MWFQYNAKLQVSHDLLPFNTGDIICSCRGPITAGKHCLLKRGHNFGRETAMSSGRTQSLSIILLAEEVDLEQCMHV